MKQQLALGNSPPLLAGKVAALLFQKPSLRTRVSFEVGMLQLGGSAVYLSPAEVQLGQREGVPDVARVLSRYVQAIIARVFVHDDVVRPRQLLARPRGERPVRSASTRASCWRTC